MQKMPPMITKPNGLLSNNDIDKKYLVFQEKTKELLKEAEGAEIGDGNQF